MYTILKQIVSGDDIHRNERKKMKKFKKMTALLSAMTMTLCGISGVFCAVAAEDSAESSGVKVSFNITDDMTPSLKTDVSLFENPEIDNVSCTVPIGTFEKDGYMFSGWTIDGIRGFLPGETYIFPEGTTEVIFEPVWYDVYAEGHDVTYDLTYKGEKIEYPEWLKDTKASAGQFVTPNYTEIQIDGAYTHEVMLDDYKLLYGQHFVMPDEDVVITPIWFARINFIFYAGDVDRLNGSTLQTFPKNEASSTDLPASDRFSRDGFNLVGWLSDYDGKVYKPLETVVAPDVDVTFTAVWEAKKYTIVFKQGNGGKNLKVDGFTDTNIICPEPDITVDGKYFAGWKDDNGNIYPAGSEYTILGAMPGVGIMLNAVWSDGEPPATTEPVSTTTTTSAETTTTTSSSGTSTETTTTVSAPETSTETTVSTSEKPDSAIIGDANEDGKVTIADAASIIQALGNPDKYSLSEQGMENAQNCDGVAGLTAMDALAIQKLEAGMISSLPDIAE